MAKASKTIVKTTKAETIDIGIDAKDLKGSSQQLEICLANEHILYIKTRNFHWNVEGMSFGPLHELFEEQYKEIETSIDETAERIRKLGFFAMGSLKGFLDIALIKEHTSEGTSAKDMLRILAEDHEAHIRFLREAIDKCDNTYNDVGTADFLTGLIREHEKMAWMLRVHLK